MALFNNNIYHVISLLIIFATAYTIGSINFSILLFKASGRNDPREQFSGNAGTTNVYRQGGPVWATVILLLDTGRAIGIAALAIYFIQEQYAPLVCFGLVLGNRFPCFHKFRGGKGVASYLGYTGYISPQTALISILIWLLVFGIKRTPFIASMFMIVTLGVGTIMTFNYNTIAITGTGLIISFIIFNHNQNITDLLNT